MNEPGFLDAGDDAGANAGLPFDSRQKLPAVSRLAGGTRRGRQHLVHAVRFCKAAKLRQRLQRRGHRLCRQRLAVEPAGAEADHDFFAIHDLEREIRPHADDDHVNGVRPDIDRCDTHVESL
jgi:hypothetical protein